MPSTRGKNAGTSKSAAKTKPATKPVRSKVRQLDSGEPFERRVEEEGDNQFVKALGRGLEVLSAFKAGEGPLGNIELAERTNLPTATVSRITYTLAQRGFLTFNRRMRMYELGGEAFALGRVAMANLDVRRVARPYIQELANKSGFNVGLGTRDRNSMIYTDAYEGGGLIGLRLFAGSRIPIVTSAMGRAYLAGLPDEERVLLLEELKPLYPDWGRILEAVEGARREVDKLGFCASLGDWQKEIHGIAAPVRMANGEQIFAINLGGPSYALTDTLVWNELGPALAEIAKKVESVLAG